ncbi:hypothetical protein M8818_007802 [Zalaria obscura]|uniref:Uncharacterized protein n=1 Tax=Zalaria obscura TaxID=2024903 RepID=A0ACC3S5A1_9PEZI
MKNPRLRGADLYVARLGSCKDDEFKSRTTSGANVPGRDGSSLVDLTPTAEVEKSPDSNTGSTSDMSLVQSKSSLTSTGSLHEELKHSHSRSRSQSEGAARDMATTASDHSAVHASRPCYRCIVYMHSVGIRRVFWTNDKGQWEGGKVRDLMDALDGGGGEEGPGEASGIKGGPLGNGVFVTKHEVLMLRRLMGEN